MRLRLVMPVLAAALLLAAPASHAQAPRLTIATPPERLVNGELRFTVATSTKLGGTGGSYVELRGLDLTKSPRSSYSHPDVSATGCVSSPCRFEVGRPAGSRYVFRAFLVDSRNGVADAQSPAVQVSWPSLPIAGLTFLLNGKPRPTVEVFEAIDDYVPVAAKTLNVEAHWKRRAGASGFFVTISTLEPAVHEYARCTTGTSCLVKETVPLTLHEEISWLVGIHKNDGTLIDGYQFCLSGAK